MLQSQVSVIINDGQECDKPPVGEVIFRGSCQQVLQGFEESTIFPIPKDKRKSLNKSDNYRAGGILSLVF
jgi:hypothetical protein